MSDAALPKIKVTDAHLDVSKEQQAIASPTTPEGEHPPRPRSATSSEGR
jgi:hypothetical protein